MNDHDRQVIRRDKLSRFGIRVFLGNNTRHLILPAVEAEKLIRILKRFKRNAKKHRESRMPLPDPIERMEQQWESHMEDLEYRESDGTMLCVECRKRFPLEEMQGASSSPAAPPICMGCLEKIQPHWRRI